MNSRYDKVATRPNIRVITVGRRTIKPSEAGLSSTASYYSNRNIRPRSGLLFVLFVPRIMGRILLVLAETFTVIDGVIGARSAPVIHLIIERISPRSGLIL